jgi:16S rRNA (uracil1498-N3)-methyltransferase
MNVFYAPSADQGFAILSDEESRHCVKVLRMRPGEEVFLTDGKGGWFSGVLAEADPRACLVQVREARMAYRERPVRLHIAVAPTKQTDRLEWFLEKATECGIDEVTPVICEKSERTVVKPERLERVLLTAMKQSLRAYLPRLNPARPLAEFLESDQQGEKFIAHCREGEKKGLLQDCPPGRDVLVLIGPEGDFTAGEVELALGQAYRPVSMGPHRLRTETAALTACIAFNLNNGLL